MAVSPAIILDRPQMGENIGAAARAMYNFGLTDLRLVAPRDGWPSHEAERNSAGALDKIAVQVFETFEVAIADLQSVYATTARPRDLVKPVLTPAGAMEASVASGYKTGFVFGCERTGLENEQVALCHGIIQIPCNPDFSSFNLAQAVLLIGYEYMLRQDAESAPVYEPAPHQETMVLLSRLEEELEFGGFFKSPDLKPTTLNNIRALLTRAQMTEHEIRTFHGIITALRK